MPTIFLISFVKRKVSQDVLKTKYVMKYNEYHFNTLDSLSTNTMHNQDLNHEHMLEKFIKWNFIYLSWKIIKFKVKLIK